MLSVLLTVILPAFGLFGLLLAGSLFRARLLRYLAWLLVSAFLLFDLVVAPVGHDHAYGLLFVLGVLWLFWDGGRREQDNRRLLKDALLLTLARGESYGPELADHLRTLGLDPSQRKLYPALRQLELDGLLVSREGPPLDEQGGRPRRYYNLTSTGQRAAATATAPAALSPTRPQEI